MRYINKLRATPEPAMLRCIRTASALVPVPPDGHAAWRGDAIDDARTVLNRARGAARSRSRAMTDGLDRLHLDGRVALIADLAPERALRAVTAEN